KAGRAYKTQPTGRRMLPSTVDGVALDNVAEIPAEYDPARPWQLRVQLHGGVGRPAPAAGQEIRPLADRIPGAPEIVLHPRAWAGSEWWTAAGADNIMRLVDRMKREYNVDASRVYVSGISDGGTGVFFLGMRLATPWSACVSLNGHPSVLASEQTGADGELFITNLVNCPLLIRNWREGPPVSGPIGRTARRHDAACRRIAALPCVRLRRPRRELVAGRATAVSGIRRDACASGASRTPVLGNRADRSLQPDPLARDRSTGRTRVGCAPRGPEHFRPQP